VCSAGVWFRSCVEVCSAGVWFRSCVEVCSAGVSCFSSCVEACSPSFSLIRLRRGGARVALGGWSLAHGVRDVCE